MKNCRPAKSLALALFASVSVSLAGAQSRVVELAVPNLEGFEPGVVAQLDELRKTAQSTLDDRTAATVERARVVSELARTYTAYRLFELAAEAFEIGLADSPNDFEDSYLYGVVLQEIQRFEAASAAFAEAIQQRPADGPTRLRRGQTLLALGELELARGVLGAARESPGQAAAAEAALAELATRQGDHEAAARRLRAVLDAQPDATSLHYPLALALRRLGRDSEARAHLSRRGSGPVRFADPLVDALASRVRSAQPHILAALAANATGSPDRALEHYSAALEVNPESLAARRGLATTLLRLGQTDRAIVALEAVLEVDSRSAVSWFDLGQVHLERGALEEAKRSLRRAVEVGPDFHRATIALARMEIESPTEELGGLIARLESAATTATTGGVGSREDRELAAEANVLLALIKRESSPEEALAHASAGIDTQSDEQFVQAVDLLVALDGCSELAAASQTIVPRLPSADRLQVEVTETLLDCDLEHDARSLLEAASSRSEQPRIKSLLALLLASPSDGSSADPERALRLARQAVRVEANAFNAAAVAVAYSALGDWSNATLWQARVVKNLEANGEGDAPLLLEARQRLSSFERQEAIGKPWRAHE